MMDISRRSFLSRLGAAGAGGLLKLRDAAAQDPALLSRVIDSNPSLLETLTPKWNEFIPHEPTPKQRAFLLLDTEEAFYGGAAGGGKSDAAK